MLLSDERKNKLAIFAANLNLDFSNFELLNSAFCHTSYAYENNLSRLESYERLEFLGDAVLKLSVSDLLCSSYPDKYEGQLTEKRAIAVSDKTIAIFAERIGMEELILTGKCEGDEGKIQESILACAFEALLGAIYLENGDKGYTVAKKFIIDNFKNDILNVAYINPKAQLQEFTQAYNHNLPEYVLMDAKGPEHKKVFTIGVYYENKFIASSKASSKKEAEMAAAAKALIKLKEIYKSERDGK